MSSVINIEKRYDLNPVGPAYVVVGFVNQAPQGVSGLTGSSSPAVQVLINRSYDLSKWSIKMNQMESLQEGWNGYSAPPPSSTALLTARGFLSNLLNRKYEPVRLAPSAVGGVGFTHKKDTRRVVVEFFNNGEVCALFSDNETEPLTKRVHPGYQAYNALINEIKEYLDA